MTAFVLIAAHITRSAQRAARGVRRIYYGLPGGRPVFARFPVAKIYISARPVGGDIVVPEPRDPSVLRILMKAVSACGIRYEGAVFVGAEIIYPGRGRIRTRYNELLIPVVEITVFHRIPKLDI
jgi:hypothetical protein